MTARDQKRRATELIAGRERIPAADALTIFGRFPTPDREGDLPAAYGVPLADDGTCAAVDVLRALDRRAARRSARAVPMFDVEIDARRIAHNRWALSGRRTGPLGLLGVHYFGPPLARPAPWLSTWIAESDDRHADAEPFAFAAPSARFAAIAMLRRAGANVVEPPWAANVRELGADEALEVTAIAAAKAGGKPYERVLLTPAEAAEITPLPNPGDDHGVQDVRAEAPVPSPALPDLQSRHNHHGPQWSIRAVAHHLHVKPSTVAAYRARNQMPEPDGHFDDKPWWRPDTITQWHQHRPGHGGRPPRTPPPTGSGPTEPDHTR